MFTVDLDQIGTFQIITSYTYHRIISHQHSKLHYTFKYQCTRMLYFIMQQLQSARRHNLTRHNIINTGSFSTMIFHLASVHEYAILYDINHSALVTRYDVTSSVTKHFMAKIEHKAQEEEKEATYHNSPLASINFQMLKS